MESVSVKILVTGGAGFIGSHLAEALNYSGHSVVAIDSLTSFLYPTQSKIRNIEKFEVHTATKNAFIELTNLVINVLSLVLKSIKENELS